MNSTMDIGKKLVELCRQGKSLDAINSLHSSKVVSIEAMSCPQTQTPARIEGLPAVREKCEGWLGNHEIHKSEITGPWPHGDRFIVRYTFDATPKTGPMAGKRMTFDEAALYTVNDGKIVQEEFFYTMGA